MLASQQAYLDWMRAGRTPEMTDAARRDDKAAHATLNLLRAQLGNGECFDCTALKPGWASLPHGIFVCIDCAQIHRHLGRHLSQTKAVNTGTYLWYPEELRVMKDVGNAKAERAFAACGLPPKPSRDATPEAKLAYARAKYDGPRKPEWERAVAESVVADAATKAKPQTPAAINPPEAVKAPSASTKAPPMALALGKPPMAKPPKPPSLPGAKRILAPPKMMPDMAVTVAAPPPAPRPAAAEVNLIDFDEPVATTPPPPPKVVGSNSFFADFGL